MEDFQHFFDRVTFRFHGTVPPELPTDEHLLRYSQGAKDHNLEVLYFQYTQCKRF